MKPTALAALIAIVAGLTLPSVAFSEWSHEADENTRVPGYPGDAYSPRISSPGYGETIVVWVANQGGDERIFAQRFDPDGNPMWGSHGLQVADPPQTLWSLDVIDDANGGVFVCWAEYQEGAPQFLYAQRVTFQGTVAWASAGVRVCTYNSGQADPELLPDGAGGLYVAWRDGNSPNHDIYAARLDPAGNHLWPAAGQAVCAAAGNQHGVRVAPAPGGGMYVTWLDARNDSQNDVYGQRMSSSGTAVWTTNGIAVDAAAGTQNNMKAAASSSGDLLVIWNTYAITRAQKVSAAGDLLWEAGGVDLPIRHVLPSYNAMMATENGGLVAVISDYDSFAEEADLTAHRLDTDGQLMWGPQGVAVAGDPTDHLTEPRLALLVDGSYAIAFQDFVSQDLLAQRLDADGNLFWPDGPSVLATGPWTRYPAEIAPVLDGGFVGVWQDWRAASTDVYAQYLDANGFCGDNRPEVTGVIDRPNDQGSEVIVEWQASWLEGLPAREITRYSVWFQEQVDGGAPAREADADALAANLNLPPARVENLLRDGWIFSREVPAADLESYAAFAPTLGDSSDTGWPWFQYLVIAHGQQTWRHWSAEPGVGYSVDNLEPGVPANLVVDYQHPDQTVLTWVANQELDLRHYRIYRGDTEDFAVGPETLEDVTADTEWTAPDTQGFYKITAVDQHGNESQPASPELVVGAPSGFVPTALVLHPCTPNPFNPVATLRFDVPDGGGHVRLEVFDLTGRRVAVLEDGERPAGRHEVRWTGLDQAGRDVASGVYVARLQSRGAVRTTKLVLAR